MSIKDSEMKLFLVITVLLLSACADDYEYECQPAPIYCYRTLGGPICYAQERPGQENRLIASKQDAIFDIDNRCIKKLITQ